MFQVFDQLEVAESTACSLIETRSLGDLVPITEVETDNLVEKFFI